MSFETLILEKKAKIAAITLNRPERMNAFSPVMRQELHSVLDELAEDRQIRVITITGAGKAFCAGGDIKSWEGITAPAGRDRVKKGSQVIKKIMEMEKPVIAGVNGAAVGAGLHIALACDIVIAGEKARFQETFVNLGLIPDLGGFFNMSLRVGVPRAKELMLTARMIEAKEAESIGLVNRVVAQEELKEEVESLAKTLAQGPARAYAMIKSALDLWPMSRQAYLELEANLQGIAWVTKDFNEGKQAFLERRKPNFTGE